ncbi:hypothetical protein PMAYCL1PPCAC_11802 [Pristionchus mayeri]|uniref:phosphatidylinositol-3,5-bisphosphate 3-phosphatase n=1 Tax=Pristionchus mayeri TaxID=1317129 RepID=A0AAN4ZNN8_9BILA|nr:hypothetical protein PMAYCL1PPCAC_11802 [Pristionchus mayeri]
MSSPVDVPGRSPPHDLSIVSASPNEMYSFIDQFCSPNSFHMQSIANTLAAKPDCPFPLIPGEVLEEVAEFAASKGYLTNYRFLIVSNGKVESIAIGNMDAIDSSQSSDQLNILCKDARVIRVQTSSLDQALQWYKKLTTLSQPRPAPSLFAVKFSRTIGGKTDVHWCRTESLPEFEFDEQGLFNRWGMDPDYFAVVDYNNDYSICSSYPRNLIVPKSMDKKEIESLRDYRMLGRIPAVVWHCPDKNVLLLRASQPRQAVLNWRNDKDEKFLRLVTEYTARKRGVENSGKIKIFDCRSYMATVANRIRGGGSEREENYANMKLEYCNLPNIHNVRYTFEQLRKLFNPPVEQATFLSSLQATNWLSTIMSILSYSNKAAEQLEKGRNVLIHCSDGWDRTTQLVTLAKILVDPHYRTIEGLEELIRRDWIGYGHKFSDRNGISGTDGNERCPVFLQWLDALHQIHHKFPTRFEYSMAYLVKLAVHTSSGLFTSFCFNTVQEMESTLESEGVPATPIWRMLNSDKCYENALYDREAPRIRLSAPDNMQTMKLWNEVYRCQEVASLLSKEEETAEGGAGGRTVQATSAERESNGMERSMVKSRSSESIASTSESQTFPPTPANPPLRATESDEEGDVRERRNTRTSSGSGEATREGGGQVQQSTVPTTASTPPSTASPDVRTVLDHDGLVRFVDPTQDSARKKFAVYEENATKKEETERQRMRSEMSDVSIGGRGEDELFEMDGIMSDASVVDENDLLYTPKHVGTQVHATHCSVCRHAFGMIYSKMNCHSCGRAVCHRCCTNTYMETTDGVAKSRKACNECYSKMHSTPTPLTPHHSAPSLHSSPLLSSHHSASTGSGGRSCPDGEASSKVPPYMSPSQAVKG